MSRGSMDTLINTDYQDKKIVVFLDYMSLPQKTAQSGITLLQMRTFNVGLMQCVSVLYANRAR